MEPVIFGVVGVAGYASSHVCAVEVLEKEGLGKLSAVVVRDPEKHQDIVDSLGLEKVEEVTVKSKNYGEPKKIYGVVRLELKGRIGNFDVLAENEGSPPLIGQIVLERLDLVIEPSTKKVMPNP